jgi:hypothetical protein
LIYKETFKIILPIQHIVGIENTLERIEKFLERKLKLAQPIKYWLDLLVGHNISLAFRVLIDGEPSCTLPCRNAQT